MKKKFFTQFNLWLMPALLSGCLVFALMVLMPDIPALCNEAIGSFHHGLAETEAQLLGH